MERETCYLCGLPASRILWYEDEGEYATRRIWVHRSQEEANACRDAFLVEARKHLLEDPEAIPVAK